jgi:spore coat protein SA
MPVPVVSSWSESGTRDSRDAQRPSVVKSVVYHLLSESEPFSEFRGGAVSRWVANVLRGDNDSIVICPSADDSWGFPRAQVRPLAAYGRYEKIRRLSSRFPWFLHKMLLEALLKQGLEGLRAGDVVWVHNRPDFAVAIAPIVRGAKARLVLHMHNSHLVQWSEKIIGQLQADQIVFVSEFLREEAQVKFPKLMQAKVVYNGADGSMFYSEPGSGKNGGHLPIVLFASRLVEDKGPQVFLEAMSLLQNRKTRAKGLVVGSSNFGGSKPTKFVRALHRMAPANVEFQDYCSGKALADIFRKADIFCCSSIWNEPFGMVNVEAMATGLPVVASAVGGIPEVFRDGGGILVPGGSASELAAAIELLISEPSLRQKVAAEGYASFRKNFTWAVVKRQYEDVLASLPA